MRANDERNSAEVGLSAFCCNRRRRIAAVMTRFRMLLCAVAASLSWPAIAQHASPQPSKLGPNLVEISPRLVTSGQPSAEALATLAAQGFEAVVYLAPPTVPDAVRDEALIVGRQGLVFVNLPIRFDKPTERDFETLTALLRALGDRKVRVHCLGVDARWAVAAADRGSVAQAQDRVSAVLSSYGCYRAT
jgi:protein tyrosine phosphatase (PTP) superfamily phosphohydrolase (DUF442 family)